MQSQCAAFPASKRKHAGFRVPVLVLMYAVVACPEGCLDPGVATTPAMIPDGFGGFERRKIGRVI